MQFMYDEEGVGGQPPGADHHQKMPGGVRMLSPGELAEKLSVSRSTISRFTRTGVLPKPVRLGPATPRWAEPVIDQWHAARAPEAGS